MWEKKSESGSRLGPCFHDIAFLAGMSRNAVVFLTLLGKNGPGQAPGQELTAVTILRGAAV